MKTKLTAMVLALGAMFGAFEADAALAGNGTKADPYQIGNYADLVAFAAKVNGGELSAWAVLTADITASGSAWTPIGIDYDHSYTGTFDGQGHEISNLSNASISDDVQWRTGLFAYAGAGGTVKNVNLVDATIYGDNHVAGIVGYCDSGVTVENCSVSGILEDTDAGGISGGIVGYCKRDTVVRGCRANCTMSFHGDAGGIAGMTYGLVENCEATVKGGRGGIVGYLAQGGVVKNCRATCDAVRAGGIVGICSYSNMVENCTSSGTIVGADNHVGGVVGSGGETMIKDCSSSCSITGRGDAAGIIAHVYDGSIVNCSSTGAIIGGGGSYAGGIVGYNDRCNIERCFATGNVSGGKFVGGIAGQIYSCVMKDCYSTGDVKTTVVDEYSSASAGGIAGINSSGTIENCYSTGSVSGTTAKTGSLVGAEWGSGFKIRHSYAKAGVAGVKLIGEIQGESEVVGVRTLSAAEFTVKANFVGWDFANVWKMGDAAPLLRRFPATIYDENWAGGKVTEKELSSDEGILANAPEVEERPGWYFCGWFTASEGGAKVTETTLAESAATYYAHWGKPVAMFSASAVRASESKTVKLTINGGSLTGPSSVKVFMTYQTAAAADLDLANATINGVKVKGGLKFPLTLAWDTGDMNPVTIEIPVKADKSVEDGETFTFQIADVIGTEMDETLECTVTLDDPGYAELADKIEDGTATKAESNSWIKVSHDGIPYFRGLADPADGGKVTGSGYCPAGKKVTLKASASKGFAFAGWTTNNAARPESAPYPEGYFVATTASLVIDRTAKPAKDTKTSTTISNLTESTTFYAVFEGDARVTATPVAFTEEGGVVASEGGKVTGAGRYAPGKKVTLKATANKGFVFGGWYEIGKREQGIGNSDEDGLLSQAASFSFEMGEEDIDLYARFVTSDADKGSIVATFNGAAMSSPPDGSPAITTNVWAGVYLAWPLASEALSQTTVKVSGLPSGLKFTAKDIVDSKTKQVTVPANTIYGAPTAASKTGKDGKPTPSKVKVTVTTAGKSSATYEIALTVDSLPAWAVGSFDGAVGAQPSGTVALTIAASGKISGKILEGGRTWSLSAGEFSRVESVEGVEDGVVFYATVIAKAGKLLATNEIAVAAVNGIGVLTGTFELSNSQTFELSSYQNLWKRADTKAAQPGFKKNVVVEYYPLGVAGDKNNTVKFTFKKDGVVSFSGKIGGVSVSGSAQLVWVSGALGESALPEGWHMTIYAPPKKGFEGWCETFPVKLTLDEQNIVTAVEIGEEPEMVQLWEGGPYWATKNIGAEKPEDYGYYFWWGDTLGYKWENEQWVASDGSVLGFSFAESNTPTYGKDLATLQSEGWIISKDDTYVLAPEHDAAQAHLGDGWRMPTDRELGDLCDKCDWAWTTLNGVRGLVVRGRGAYALASIFLPEAGSGRGDRRDEFSNGYFWASVPYPDDNDNAMRLRTSKDAHYVAQDYRSYGYSIRPVQSPTE